MKIRMLAVICLILFSFSCAKKEATNLFKEEMKMKGDEKKIPVLDFSENVFSDVPQDPNFFKNDGSVSMLSERNSDNGQTKNYFDNTLLVRGNNFSILYVINEKKYVVQKVIVYGESFLEKWNSFFHLEKQLLKEKWGEPAMEFDEYLLYTNNDISVRLNTDKERIYKIEIFREP